MTKRKMWIYFNIEVIQLVVSSINVTDVLMRLWIPIQKISKWLTKCYKNRGNAFADNWKMMWIYQKDLKF